MSVPTPLGDDDMFSFAVPDVGERIGLSGKSVVRLVDQGILTALHPRRRGTPLRITARSLRAYFDAAEAR